MTSHFHQSVAAILVIFWASAVSGNDTQRSLTIRDVLRAPLPPETLTCVETDQQVTIVGATFEYRVDRASGAITAFRAVCGERVVADLSGAVQIVIDDWSLLAHASDSRLEITRREPGQVVIRVQGQWVDPQDAGRAADGTLEHVFYSDGVVVTRVTLTPRGDLAVRQSLRQTLSVHGALTHFLHKDAAHYDSDVPRENPKLPEAGNTLEFPGATSCLEVFSREAAIAIFTDLGGSHVTSPTLATAAIAVRQRDAAGTSIDLTQHIVRLDAGAPAHTLPAGQPFTFRVGLGLAPNRPAHRRTGDLRMFVWIGDAQNPYPTDAEISQAAQLGFTLFQMHRIGHPGVPRPPAAELDRVIAQVHRHGMLFLWTQNADLMYAQDTRVQELVAQQKFALWQGHLYGGRYRAAMDPYCDLLATCLASPNGLAEYRLESDGRMLDRYPVDGMYIDDNFSVAGCALSAEHGHPRADYDCLIELHDLNWRRRQLLRERCPHAVLVGHCGRGLALPVICDFDVQLYGEGRTFSSLADYWDYFGSVQRLPAQGCIWPGDTEGVRCATDAAYAFDLLTGGGQYCYIDWRLFPQKFPYAKGVTDREVTIVRNHNLAQYYFGLFESTRHYFSDDPALIAASSPGFQASAYRNEVWGDVLIAVANLGQNNGATTLRFPHPERLGLMPGRPYWLVSADTREAQQLTCEELVSGNRELRVGAASCRLLVLRPVASAPQHVLGGKRIAEHWDEAQCQLTVELDGPLGLVDSALIATAGRSVTRVLVDGAETTSQSGGKDNLARIPVQFGDQPRIMAITFGPAAGSTPAPAYRWVQVTDRAPFPPRDGAGAAVFADKMWLLGGWNPSDKAYFPHTCVSDVWSSTDGATWTRLPDAPWEGRHTAGYVIHDQKMWIVGGDPIQHHYQSDVWNSADGVNWTRVADNVPWAPRVLHYTVAHAGRIWVLGGQTTPQFAAADEVFHNDVWSSRDGVTWERVMEHAPWSPRGMIGGSVVFQGRMWLIGGGTYDTPQRPQRQFFGEVWSSADGQDWKCHTAQVPWHPRQYHETAAFDGHLWVLEGWNQANRNDVWYSEDGATWLELPNTPWAPRHAASVFVFHDALWLVAGNHFGRDVWKLERQ